MFAISGTGMYVIPGVLHSHPKPKLRAEVFPWPPLQTSSYPCKKNVKNIVISIRLSPIALNFPRDFSAPSANLIISIQSLMLVYE
jgi:hypothetical protein